MPAEQEQERLSGADPTHWLDDHGDALFRFARLRVRDGSVAEDLVQETLLAALRGHERFDGRSSERTWLVAILRRKIVDHFRKSQRTGAPLETVAEPAPDLFDRHGRWREEVLNRHVDPARTLNDREFWDAFRTCLGRLTPSLADAFVLRELEDLSTDEICKVLQISASNLWTQLHRARMMLRQCLELNWMQKEGR